MMGNSCAADQYGNIYLAGVARSDSGISFNGHQNDLEGPSDAFLAKFNTDGELQWGTYYGGEGDDAGHHCSVDRETTCTWLEKLSPIRILPT
jgi:hypothetical protein